MNVDIEIAKKMLQYIDSMLNRTMQKISLDYNKTALEFNINKGFVTVKGEYVTRLFHSHNYDIVYENNL